MKKLLVLLVLGFLLPSAAMAYQTNENSEFLTDIVSIEQDHSFPIETVTLNYIKHCSEEFSNVWLQITKPGHINLGVSVKRVYEHCSMDKPVWTNESVTVQINSEVPTVYGLLLELSLAEPFFSGISVDNFN